MCHHSVYPIQSIQPFLGEQSAEVVAFPVCTGSPSQAVSTSQTTPSRPIPPHPKYLHVPSALIRQLKVNHERSSLVEKFNIAAPAWGQLAGGAERNPKHLAPGNKRREIKNPLHDRIQTPHVEIPPVKRMGIIRRQVVPVWRLGIHKLLLATCHSL